MDIRGFATKVTGAVSKYKYAVIVLVVGLLLLLIPTNTDREVVQETVDNRPVQTFDAEALEEILQSITGAGKVRVLLSVESGENVIYQTNDDVDSDGKSKTQTVIVSDSQRSEQGLVAQINPPT